jgi:Na+-transporting methylmalonyl-CoA/oxaloacetate decarboxylase gamma subunit
MNELHFSGQNIIDSQGVSIAVTGMLIVFSTLIIISLFIAVLPRILEILKGILPSETAHHAAAPAKASAVTAAGEEEAVAVAVGFALHTRRQADGF